MYSARLNFEFPNSDQCLQFLSPYFNFSQTQFPLAALLAGMAVHPETVAQPLGVSVTVDTSWEGLEDFVMVGGQSNKTNDSYCALKNSLHTAFTPSPSISLPLLILLHFILLSLSLPFFPLSHSFPSLFLLISPSPPLPHFFFFLSHALTPIPNTDINECTQENTDCEQGCLNKIGSYKCHCFVGYQRANATHCSKLTNLYSTLKLPQWIPFSFSCIVIRRCEIKNGDCQHDCFYDVDGVGRCKCRNGRVMDPARERKCWGMVCHVHSQLISIGFCQVLKVSSLGYACKL